MTAPTCPDCHYPLILLPDGSAHVCANVHCGQYHNPTANPCQDERQGGEVEPGAPEAPLWHTNPQNQDLRGNQ